MIFIKTKSNIKLNKPKTINTIPQDTYNIIGFIAGGVNIKLN